MASRTQQWEHHSRLAISKKGIRCIHGCSTVKKLDPPPPLGKETEQSTFWEQEDGKRSIPMSSSSQGGLPDGFLLFFLAINLIFLFTNAGLICCSFAVLIPVLMINSIVSEADPSVRKRKILMYIFLVVITVYIGWKIFEANCCGYEAYGTVPF